MPGRSTVKMRCSQERLAVRGVYGAHSQTAAGQSRRLDPSPTDALINLKVRCRLRRQIRIGLNVHPLIRLRITTVIPQRWPARRGNLRRF